MMLLNYLTLFRQFLIIGYIKIYNFAKNNLLIHFKYYDFFYSGLFLHLLFKLCLYLFFNLQLYGEFNIILLLLSIYICSIIDIYYYIHFTFYKILKYLLRYFSHIPAEYFYPVFETPESEWVRTFVPYLYAAESAEYRARLNYTYKISENCNKERDRYLLVFKPIFLLLTAIRYFITREPLLFMVIHLLVIVNYLQDYNLFLLYVYLLILHISRFLYFISEEYERFKMSKWRKCFFFLTTTAHNFGFPELAHLNPNLVYDPKLIQKFTWNNMSLMLYFSLREILRASYIKIHKIKLSEIDLVLPAYYFRKSWYMLTLGAGIDTILYNLCWYIPHIYNDCQKFVKRNQMFWFAFFILFIYFENFIVTFLLALLYNEPIDLIYNNIVPFFSVEIY